MKISHFQYTEKYHTCEEKLPPGTSPGLFGRMCFYLLMAICLSAPMMTIVLIFRTLMHFVGQWGSGRRQANLRLIMIEDRLRRMEESGKAK